MFNVGVFLNQFLIVIDFIGIFSSYSYTASRRSTLGLSFFFLNCVWWDSVPNGSLQWSSSCLVCVARYSMRFFLRTDSRGAISCLQLNALIDMTPGRWSHVPALAQRWFKLFVSGCLGKLKVSCDIHVRFWIHYFRPRFLRSWCLRSFQGDLKHKVLPFCFNLITSMCVCVCAGAGVSCKDPVPATVPEERGGSLWAFVRCVCVCSYFCLWGWAHRSRGR